jgi:hypothetical protein
MSFEERRVGRDIEEPAPWPFDGDLVRRKPVINPNFDPPRVVRRVGWLRCLRCRRPHFSDDVVGARLCLHCGGLGGLPVGPVPIRSVATHARRTNPHRWRSLDW